MSVIPNPLLGLKAYLEAQISPVQVFGAELPEANASSMPEKVVVMQMAGGSPELGFLSRIITRVDVRCYGATPEEADELYLDVYSALKSMRAQTQGNCRLMSCVMESGPMHMREPEFPRWPLTVSMWNLMSREPTVEGGNS